MSHCSLIVYILFSSISWASSPWLSADLGPGVWCNPTMSHQDNCIVMSHIVFNSHTNLSVTFTRENMPHAAGACILPHPYSHIHCNGQSNISYSEKDLPFRLFHPSIDSLGYSLYPIWRILLLSVAIVIGTLESITNNLISPWLTNHFNALSFIFHADALLQNLTSTYYFMDYSILLRLACFFCILS